jgi:hypothetical protein
MSRPGMRQCDRCHGLFLYDELQAVDHVSYKRARHVCAQCVTELARLGLVK